MLACPVVATIKKVENSNIIETIDRAGLYEAQTPQVFEIGLLKRAYANLKNLDTSKISDDSQLVEALGEKVTIIETDSSNIKITRKSDITIAEGEMSVIPRGISHKNVGLGPNIEITIYTKKPLKRMAPEGAAAARERMSIEGGKPVSPPVTLDDGVLD